MKRLIDSGMAVFFVGNIPTIMMVQGGAFCNARLSPVYWYMLNYATFVPGSSAGGC
jgi:hypothetical protein